MKVLISINLAFALGFAAMLIAKISNDYYWLTFLTAWCVAEGVMARDHSIRWWQWALLLIALGCLDMTILLIFKH